METRSKRKAGEILHSKQKRKLHSKKSFIQSKKEISQEPVIEESSSSTTNEMEFPRNYRENYLRLLESVTYGTRTDLGKRWSTELWSNFAKELRKECGGNLITAFMCTEHLKGLRTIKNTMDHPGRAKYHDVVHVDQLDESYKTRVHEVLYVGSLSIPKSSSQSYCSNPSARSSGSKSIARSSGSKPCVIEEMEKLLKLFFKEKDITLDEHVILEKTLLPFTASCNLVLELDDYNLQLQHVRSYLTKQCGGGSGGGGGGGSSPRRRNFWRNNVGIKSILAIFSDFFEY